jgi:hypothetical protein
MAEEKKKPKLPFGVRQEQVVEKTAKDVDLSQYIFTGTRIILEIPTEAHGSDLIIYPNIETHDVWFTVVALGADTESNYVGVGDQVLIDENLPFNQITKIVIEKVPFLSLQWHEITTIKKRNVEVDG